MSSDGADVHEGCRIHGHLEVNKVAGNFHIAPGQSFQQNHIHVHSLQNIRLNLLNTSHIIDDLSFGEPFPQQINPLSGTKEMVNEGAVLYHYYIKVVPSTYVFLNRTQIRTNQYSVTKHRKVVQNIAAGNNHQLPGTFFTYEISAIMVKFVEEKRSFAHFLTTLCALIVSSAEIRLTVEKSIDLGRRFHGVESHRCVSLSWKLFNSKEVGYWQSNLIVVILPCSSDN